MIVVDFENIYNAGFLVITIWAFTEPFAYCILLLDVIKKSEDLKNIIRAIT